MAIPSNIDLAKEWERVKDSTTMEKMAHKYGITKDALDARIYRGRKKIGDNRDNNIVEPPPETALDKWDGWHGEVLWEEILDHARKGADLQDRMRPIRTEARRKITTDRDYILLVSMSDFHLGSPATDYHAFLETTTLLKNDERFFIIICGPDLETAFSWFRDASAVLDQTIPPWMQIEAYRQWLDGMLPQTVAVTGDNHTDERLERRLGDIGLTWRDDLPYFRTWGILTLEINDVEYEIMMSHKYKGSSIYHDFQPAFRMSRDIYSLADVYITAHTHVPAYARGVWKERDRPDYPIQHFIVNGTFKNKNAIYPLRNFGGSGVLGLPTMRLGATDKEITVFNSPEEALKVCKL